MIKFHVHDYYFEEFKIPNSDNEQDFCVSVTIYYNFSPEDPGDGWENLAYLNITVANPSGLAKYLNKCMAEGTLPDKFFFPHVYFCERFNKEEIMHHFRTYLQSITVNSENELLLKAIRNFSWEFEPETETLPIIPKIKTATPSGAAAIF